MKTIFKKLCMAAALTAASSVAYAVPITVGGITWDPDYDSGSNIEDLYVVSSLEENVVSSFGETISGFGIVNEFNGLPRTLYCGADCVLAYEFGGYSLFAADFDNSAAIGDVGTFSFTGGWINVYVVSYTDAADYNLTAAEKAAGTLWLSANAVAMGQDGITLSGSINFDDVILGPVNVPGSPVYAYGNGSGYFDVGDTSGVSDGGVGVANNNFDTNNALGNKPFNTPCVGGDPLLCSDMFFSSLFNGLASNIGSGAQDFQGSATLRGDSIPEPTTIALFGLTLLGLGVARRKMKA
ncbi:MAG: PEP-CTERM sorting domain-containing protein [Sedimenticola sp.]|nr:PEP-CTERM sorting domain-containing protein [Sedimenticola sp.]